MRWGLALPTLLAAFRPLVAMADEASKPAADWTERNSGHRISVGGGLEFSAFPLFPSAVSTVFEASFDLRLAREVDIRFAGSLGLQLGEADDTYVAVLPGALAALRVNPSPYYSLWLGYGGKLGLAAELGDADSLGVLPLHGPSLSLSSFRFGSRGQFELDHWGTLFVAPIWGYGASLLLRYSFPDS